MLLVSRIERDNRAISVSNRNGIAALANRHPVRTQSVRFDKRTLLHVLEIRRLRFGVSISRR